MKKFLFITSTNLASNPRLVKEITIAGKLGFSFKVIQFKLYNWSDKETEKLELDFKGCAECQFYSIPAKPDNRFKHIYFALLEKSARIIYPIIKKNLFVNSIAHSRRSLQICRELKKQNFKPNLIVAHNLPALFPAYKYSLRHKVPFLFDNEDYHPGETISGDIKNETSRREFLLKQILPKSSALLSASPMIAEFVNNLIGNHQNHQVVLNGFPENQFIEPSGENQDGSMQILKMVWFSQNINYGRGLEQLFLSLKNVENRLPCKLKINLIGNLNKDFHSIFLGPQIERLDKNLIEFEFMAPMSQQKLHNKLSEFDIGLAVELKNVDINRDICLTNKIIAYAQSGLFILATNTRAQVQFLNDYPLSGLVVDQNIEGLSKGLVEICNRKDEILYNKLQRFNLAKNLSWESEQQKLINIWEQIE